MERIAVGFGAPQGQSWQPWPEFRLAPGEPPIPPKDPTTSSGYPVEGDAGPEQPKNPPKTYSIPAS